MSLEHLSNDRREAALADFNRAIAIDDTYAWAYFQRGQVLRELGRLEESLTDLTRACELEADPPLYHAERGAHVTYASPI
jgi:Tetratricopeptide repeat.